MTSLELADIATGEIVHRVGASRLTPEQAKEQAEWVRSMRRSVLVEGTDFGVIPGTEKPCLYKPGAEMLLLAAGLGSRTTRTEIDRDEHGERVGVYYVTTVHRGDVILAECEGYAGYDESRFFTSLEDADAKERRNAAQYQRPVRQAKIVEYKAPWNSVIKMAQKRAFVGATLLATAASGLFTQDLEDEQTSEPTTDRRADTAKAGTDAWARELGWDGMTDFQAAEQAAIDRIREHVPADDQKAVWDNYKQPDGPNMPARTRTKAEYAEWSRAQFGALDRPEPAWKPETGGNPSDAPSRPEGGQGAAEKGNRNPKASSPASSGPPATTPPNGAPTPTDGNQTDGDEGDLPADNGFRDDLDDIARTSLDDLIGELRRMNVDDLEQALDNRDDPPDPADMPTADEMRRQLGALVVRNTKTVRAAQTPGQGGTPIRELPHDNGHRSTAEKTLVEKGDGALRAAIGKQPHGALVKQLNSRGFRDVMTTDSDDDLRGILHQLVTRNVETDAAGAEDAEPF